MPENLESTSLTPETTPVDSATVEATSPEPVIAEPEVRQVPLADLLDERHSRQELQARVEQLTGAQIQLQQHLLAMQQQANGPQEKLDPEIQKLLDPYLAPYKAALADTQAQARQAQEQLSLQQKMDYVKANLPELDSIGPELAKEIGAMDKSEQDVFLSNPRAIVRLGKTILREKAVGTATAAKQAARSAGRVESASTSTSSSADAVSDAPDWSKMSSEDFANHPLVKAMGL